MKIRSKKWASWLLLLTALFLPAIACNVPGQVQPTEVLFSSTRTPISTNTLGPPPTLIPPTATSPIPSPTTGPTPTYEPGFSEPFDIPLANWMDWFTLTTQSPGGILQSSFSQRNGTLTITLADQETYLYRYYKLPQPMDSYVEAEFKVEGQKENQAALICRAAEDHSAWFEARISGTGIYQIYRYDRSRKTQEGLNPFVPLAEGAASASAYEAGQMNLVRLSCRGNKLTLDFNRGSQLVEVEDDHLQNAGLLGFGVMAYSNLPTTIQFDEVNAGVP